jgi:hypothetical protein
MKTSDYPFEPTFPAPAAPVTFQSEISQTFTNGLSNSYSNGIVYGLTDAQLVFLQILNDRKFQITVDELREEFMRITQSKIDAI